ncbi:MAG: zf-HC2 domain-containing protein [Candidatus Sulfopaludibacter sp.]|nr:zf-HC2 domain-containing protein [Candidatus Sulfopaludibacter sp.]
MKQCLREGELRAWLDGELPAEQVSAAERHVAECAECAARHRQVADRAALVSGWMESLSAGIPGPVAMPRRPARRAAVWVAVSAIAAGLILAAVLSRPQGRTPVKAALAQPPASVAVQEPPAATAVVSVPVLPVRRAPARRARTAPVQYYMALDEEPIDTGLVMRVALPSGLQADVIVDGDGRARAIRPISVVKEEQ